MSWKTLKSILNTNIAFMKMGFVGIMSDLLWSEFGSEDLKSWRERSRMAHETFVQMRQNGFRRSFNRNLINMDW